MQKHFIQKIFNAIVNQFTTTAVLFSLSILQCFLLHDLKQRRWHYCLIKVEVFMTLPPIA